MSKPIIIIIIVIIIIIIIIIINRPKVWVARSDGTAGEITCQYATVEDTAREGEAPELIIIIIVIKITTTTTTATTTTTTIMFTIIITTIIIDSCQYATVEDTARAGEAPLGRNIGCFTRDY